MLAKDGYVVGGLIESGKNVVSAVRVMFVRSNNGKISSSDHYFTRWYGTVESNSRTQMAGHGEKVIGLFGRAGHYVDALGLVIVDTAVDADEPAGN